jgi:two-component system sensor histidine kinase MprB
VSFKARLAVAASAAVAAAVVLLVVFTYIAVRSELRGQVDSALRDFASNVARRPAIPDPARSPPPVPRARLGGPTGYIQLVNSAGQAQRPPGAATALPIDARTVAVAKRTAGQFLTDATVDGTHVRILTSPGPEAGTATQLARPLTEVDGVLRRVSLLLVLGGLVGIAAAAAAGLAVARTALAPMRRLTRAAEHVAATQDLSSRIDAGRRDELGRLGRAFNRMLDALARSRSAQQQLIADASHELRTPLTSVRANLEVLAAGGRFPEPERKQMLDDLVAQTGELTVLVGDLVELARDPGAAEPTEAVRLDEVVGSAVARVVPRAPGITIELGRLDRTTVVGDSRLLERAVVNLLDNALKFSPDDGRVDVSVAGGRIVVRDHGPGIPEEELPLVFDRFYRGVPARSMPGSGLGLAIVRKVAEQHRGLAFAERPEGGGAQLVMDLPTNGAGRQ